MVYDAQMDHLVLEMTKVQNDAWSCPSNVQPSVLADLRTC